jgi:putative hydrolase of the HAD superfamily
VTGVNSNHSSQIKAVIFDYGEVLCFPPTAAQIGRMADIFALDAGRFRRLYEKNRRAYDRGDLTAEAYWLAFGADVGVQLNSEKIATLRAWDTEMWSRSNPAMVEWVAALRAAGTRTGLLSNMQEDMVARVRRDFPWVADFDCAVFSHEVGLAKPEAEIYQRCLEGLGAAPQETLFIDDRPNNIKAAQELGIQAIRMQSVAQLRTELVSLGFALLPAAPDEL